VVCVRGVLGGRHLCWLHVQLLLGVTAWVAAPLATFSVCNMNHVQGTADYVQSWGGALAGLLMHRAARCRGAPALCPQHHACGLIAPRPLDVPLHGCVCSICAWPCQRRIPRMHSTTCCCTCRHGMSRHFVVSIHTNPWCASLAESSCCVVACVQPSLLTLPVCI
jgi:hypothetical protein